MPGRKTKKMKPRTTLSLAVKKKGKFVPIPKASPKRARQIILGEVKTPPLFVVKKRAGKVIESKRVG